MSATSLYIVDTLKLRANRTGLKDISAGTKKSVKKMLNRSGRVAGRCKLAQELKALNEGIELSDQFDVTYQGPSSDELEAVADQLLANDPYKAVDDTRDSEEIDWVRPLPLELLGSLPDWMLDQMEAANGDSFAHLSLFEEKRPRSTAGLLVEELAEAA